MTTYSSFPGSLSITTLERDAMTLMLQALRSDEALNFRRLGIWLLALAFRLNLTTDHKLADLNSVPHISIYSSHTLHRFRGQATMIYRKRTSSSLVRPKNFLIFVARLGPRRFGYTVSVTPGMSLSPFLTIERASTERSMPTIQPRTDLRLRSPVRRGR